ncbi:MAG: ABC transporter permease [Chloroflexota bacterium]|nr:ABC transporter permease [Dehalococcoidia bacterium]MDW8253145.1 ABC transporter permease [Chloroflexota bacterium]
MISKFDLSLSAVRVWQRNRDVFLRLWRTESWPPFLEAFITLLAFGFGMGAYVALGGEEYIVFLAPGLIAQSAFFGATFETTFGSFFRLDSQKTFDAILATPLSVDDIVVGEILWGATRGVISATALLIAVGAFGLAQSPAALGMIPVAFLGGAVFAAIGLCFTAVAPSVNAFNYFFSLYFTPSLFFGGVFFPLDRLPDWVRILAWFIPMTHVTNLSRSLNRGSLGGEAVIDLAFLGVAAVSFSIIAIVLMRRRLIR